MMETFSTELAAFKVVSHENIIRIFDWSESEIWTKRDGSQREVAFIALEFVEGGELFSYVINGGAFPETICRFYFTKILSAMMYLHSKGIVHRDLKLDNILVDSDTYDIKIADFGFAIQIWGRDGTGQLYTKRGTPEYMAPEIWEQDCYPHGQAPGYDGAAIDTFACGVILFNLMTGFLPFVAAYPSNWSQQDPYYKFFNGHDSDGFWSQH